MKPTEKLLLLLSRKPGSENYASAIQEYDKDNALDILLNSFSKRFLKEINNRVILDFGCGAGWQSLSLALNGAKSVTGIDSNSKQLNKAIELAQKYKVRQKIEFKKATDKTDVSKFDIIISQNSFEHFQNPEAILKMMKTLLKENGKIYITFGPPWFAPYGSHMQFFTKMPWINLLFSEKTVMKVRSYFRNDGALKYGNVESGLNKMTIKKFEKIISNSGMKIAYKKYHAIKGINVLSFLSLIRELIVNHVDCILMKN